MRKIIIPLVIVGLLSFSLVVFADSPEQEQNQNKNMLMDAAKKGVESIKNILDFGSKNSSESDQGVGTNDQQDNQDQQDQQDNQDISANPQSGSFNEQQKQALERQQEQLKNQLEQQQQNLEQEREKATEQLKQQVEKNRENLKQTLEKEREQLKQQLQKIKDTQKQNIVETVDTEIDDLNTQITDHYSALLAQLNDVLTRINSRADKEELSGVNVSAVRTAIATAKTDISTASAAVAAQASKTYAINITTENQLGTDVGKTRQSLHNDLVNVRNLVKAARDAVHNAAIILGQVSTSGTNPSPTASGSSQ